MCFYKGYIITKDKKAIDKFSDPRTHRTLEQASQFEEFAGVLADDAILVDFDDEDSAKKALDIIEREDLICRAYKTTRGVHILFKNKDIDKCGTHTRLACGLNADIKCGRQSCYEVLKYAGQTREILYDKYEDEEYDYIPKFFYPVKSKTDFCKMEQGDGRNQALFNYILTLQSNGFSKEEARQCLKIINDFVLSDKLSDKELDTICRDESFEAPIFYDAKNRFLFDKFALYMIAEHNIIKIDNNLYIFDNGVYTYDPLRIENYMIKHIPQLTKATRAEIMAYIAVVIGENSEPAPARYIAFNNGVYDFETNKLLEYDPSMILLNKIPHDYNPHAFDEVCNKTLNKLACDDKAVRKLLEEAIGYCFYRRNELRKSFVLTGEKANGKSTYLDMIRNVLGHKNISSLDIHELSDRFKTAELCDKLANIGDDIGASYIAETGVLKKVISGDRLNVERKGEDPFEFDNYSKQLFSANDVPRFKDATGAVADRMVIIPFNAKFNKEDPDFDPFIKYKLRSENVMEYLINIGIKALRNVLEKQAFSVTDKLEELREDFDLNNNPIKSYLALLRYEDIYHKSCTRVYVDYKVEAGMLGNSPLAEQSFRKEIERAFGLKRKMIETENGREYVYG